MTALEGDQRKIARAKNKAFWIGLSLAMLIGLAVVNVFLLLFVVPKFEQIFADALPGKPLPGATNFIVGYRFLLTFVAVGWPPVCICARKGQRFYAILLINLGIVWFLFEIGTTIIALFMPMVSGTTGMSDAGK